MEVSFKSIKNVIFIVVMTGANRIYRIARDYHIVGREGYRGMGRN